MNKNALYFGDNLDILQRYIPDETVDLIYLDPPFNSNASYNVLFAEHNGTRAAAQIQAFEDTWQWDKKAEETYLIVVESDNKVSLAMQAFRTLLGTSNMMAYLVMMAPRLMEMRRVLKSTGSIYLHCDPTASHYLKLLMDTVFGLKNYRNEIAWCYKDRERPLRQWNRKHDILLYYSKDINSKQTFNWEAVAEEYSDVTLGKFKYEDDEGVYRIRGHNIKGSSYKAQTDLPYEVLIKHPDLVYKDRPAVGVAPRDWWEISFLNQAANERMGYPTQKPLALLERIIKASSNEGDLVLDPFCGCGTTIVAAQELKRKWIGIDITHIAINLMKNRLLSEFGSEIEYDVIGEPQALPDAEELARTKPYQFQLWALGLVGARPGDLKKGSDRGIDGILFFHDEADSSKTKKVIFSVKGGHTSVKDVRDLVGVVDREKAQIGVLISLQEPTSHMRKEAVSAGFYDSLILNKRYQRIQILTIAELMDGRVVDMPPKGLNITLVSNHKPKSRKKNNGMDEMV